jgi:thiol-disulfide isomerase/thioredoxin
MMKSILMVALIAMTCVGNAQQTLTVIEQDYELAKRTAQQQQKLLIIDFYTTWCVPCKMLDKTIFKNDSIAGEIAKNFVVLRYDTEKDSVHNLSLKHHVCSYPTTVVLTADGKMISKMFGTGGNKPLVESYAGLLRESILLSRKGKYIEGVSTTIDPDSYPVFYKKYVRRIADIKPGELGDYWAGNKNLQSEVSLAILAYFGSAPGQVMEYFVRHKADYEQRFGKADVAFIMERIISEKFSAAITAKDEARYKAAIKFAKQHLVPDNVNKYINTYSLELYIAKKEWNRAADLVEEQVLRKTISENGINYFCWTVYEQCDDKKVIGQAVHLMKNVTDTNPSFAMLDTYARLYAKSGNKQEAIDAMKRAIAIGKANNEDTKESEEALSKF